MQRRPVASSSLVSVGYDPERHELEAEFHNGRVYRYFGVPARLFEDLLGAPSLGTFFNAEIRNRFPYRRV